MKYYELNEMKFEDWDGKPFEAVVTDYSNIRLFEIDDAVVHGKNTGFTIVEYSNGRWVDETGARWRHAYPVAKNLYLTTAEENFDAAVGKLKNMLQKLETMYKDCSECRDNVILERNALQKRVQELEAKLAEKS